MKTAFHSLRRRLVIAFMAFSLLTALLFSFLSIVFAYSVEDSFFYRMLQDEAAHQVEAMQRTGQPAAPKNELIAIYTDPAELPSDLRRQYLQEPHRQEFGGDDGRHYHLLTRQADSPQRPDLLLVAEVSQHLAVRPVRTELLWFLAKTATAVLLLTCLIGYWLARRATAPLSALAEQIAETEPDKLPKNLAAHYPNNEIGVVARSLESALQRIEAFIQREQHFTRDASHELRTPIAVVQSAAELLAQQTLPDSARLPLQRIQLASNQMEQTVNLLLSLARELPSTDKSAVALLPLIETSVVQAARLLEGKPVQVIVDVAADCHVNGHRTVLAIILGNLIGNAFQYTAEGEVRIHADNAQLTIADTGVGIAPELQPRLFEPLVKGEHSNGFGIGLSLVARLCQRYDIDLAVESMPAGGTRATLRFI
jgi:signal transduction histidine kinase